MMEGGGMMENNTCLIDNVMSFIGFFIPKNVDLTTASLTLGNLGGERLEKFIVESSHF